MQLQTSFNSSIQLLKVGRGRREGMTTGRPFRGRERTPVQCNDQWARSNNNNILILYIASIAFPLRTEVLPVNQENILRPEERDPVKKTEATQSCYGIPKQFHILLVYTNLEKAFTACFSSSRRLRGRARDLLAGRFTHLLCCLARLPGGCWLYHQGRSALYKLGLACHAHLRKEFFQYQLVHN